jgi:hypothetical protein
MFQLVAEVFPVLVKLLWETRKRLPGVILAKMRLVMFVKLFSES